MSRSEPSVLRSTIHPPSHLLLGQDDLFPPAPQSGLDKLYIPQRSPRFPVILPLLPLAQDILGELPDFDLDAHPLEFFPALFSRLAGEFQDGGVFGEDFDGPFSSAGESDDPVQAGDGVHLGETFGGTGGGEAHEECSGGGGLTHGEAFGLGEVFTVGRDGLGGEGGEGGDGIVRT